MASVYDARSETRDQFSCLGATRVVVCFKPEVVVSFFVQLSSPFSSPSFFSSSSFVFCLLSFASFFPVASDDGTSVGRAAESQQKRQRQVSLFLPFLLFFMRLARSTGGLWLQHKCACTMWTMSTMWTIQRLARCGQEDASEAPGPSYSIRRNAVDAGPFPFLLSHFACLFRVSFLQLCSCSLVLRVAVANVTVPVLDYLNLFRT